MVDAANWLIKYAVVLGMNNYRFFRFQRWLESRTGLFFKLVLFCFLRLFGSYNPNARIARCVRDYAGKQWKTQVEVMNVKQYNKAVSDSGTKGWFFENRLNENRDLHQTEGNATTATPGV
jgi:hypothetical protein